LGRRSLNGTETDVKVTPVMPSGQWQKAKRLRSGLCHYAFSLNALFAFLLPKTLVYGSYSCPSVATRS